MTNYDDKASALVIFPDIRTACETVAILKTKPVSAVELMDRASLRSVENKSGVPAYLKELAEPAAALLIETRAQEQNTLDRQIDAVYKAVAEIKSLCPINFSSKEEKYGKRRDHHMN